MFYNQNQLAREINRLSRVQITVGGLKALPFDKHQFISTTLCRYGLESDLLGYHANKACVYRRVIHGLTAVDLKTYAQDMKVLKLSFIRHWQMSPGTEGSWRDFKRRTSGQITYKWLFCVLEKLWFVSFKACLQWLSFDERLLIHTPLQRDFEGEYIAQEEALRDMHLDDRNPDISEIRSVISDWFRDFSFGIVSAEPRYGPGAVAEYRGRWPVLHKWTYMQSDKRVAELFARLYDRDANEFDNCQYASWPWYRNRIIFRPKNALSKRVISAEPSWLSWYQQAIKNPWYDYVEKHPKINTWFSNQGQSRKLALRGSVDCSYATFDFSSASDSITCETVAVLFRDTYVVDALLATRSLEAQLPSKRIIPLRKFAPMGSATCFGTMDVIIASICEVAIRHTMQRTARKDDYVVYGDDCTIRAEAADEFARIATQLIGFSINFDKSYADSVAFPYRESCGIEAYCGADVTPVRYSRFQEPLVGEALADDVRQISQSVALMNECALAGFWNTRSVVQECYKHLCNTSDEKFARKMYSIWNHLLRIDVSDYARGADGPLAVVVPDGTATNYRNDSRNAPPKDIRQPWYQVPTVRVPYYRVRSKNIHQDRAGYPLSEENLLDLWYIFAETELPTEADASLLAGVAGTTSGNWGWTWTPW